MMALRLPVLALSVLATSAACFAATIPPAQRLPARVVATLASPVEAAMNMPTGVAVGGDGRVFVADGVNHRIVVFDAEGRVTGDIRSVGETMLARPIGLHVDGRNWLWIADASLNRVVAVATAGATWPGRADLLIELRPPLVRRPEGLEPSEPTDVTVSRDGSQVYIVDNEHHRLVLQDLKTQGMQVIGGPGQGLGQFQWPFTISLGPDGYLYVCEAIGARVQRLNPAGRPAGRIGAWGVEMGQLYRPKGVVVGGDGSVYVSDSTLGAVQVFRTDGTLRGVLTDVQGTPLRFQHPMGMDLDARGRLYVVELTANRVAVVEVGGAAASTQPAMPAGRGRP